MMVAKLMHLRHLGYMGAQFSFTDSITRRDLLIEEIKQQLWQNTKVCNYKLSS